MNEPILRVKNLSKSFSGVKVLENIDYDIYPGQVHALLGENGAGKSTLVNIISGVHTPNEGEIFFEGNQVRINNPHEAIKLGITLIHQEPHTFPDLNVAENVFAGHTRDTDKVFINWKEKRRITRELLDSLNLTIDETALVSGMSIADQQMIEIVCALSTNSKVIIMDEPTASLSLGEVQSLFKIIKQLTESGKAIIFIGHRLEEIEEIADRIMILRDGKKVAERFAKETSREEMVQLMIGRTLGEHIAHEKHDQGEVLLKVEHLTLPGKFEDISIDVRRGEIVGMAGLVGAGRTDVAHAIFGISSPVSGTVSINNQKVEIHNPKEAIEHGIALVPEDRQNAGILMPFTIKQNMTFVSFKKILGRILINSKKEKDLVRQYQDKLQIKMKSAEQEVRELSGGNQQKVVLSKWLMTEPEIFILDEPTRGIDVGAKAEVYKLINALASEGKAILMISSEMFELIQLCDRIYVMREGKLTASLPREECTELNIMTAAVSADRERRM